MTQRFREAQAGTLWFFNPDQGVPSAGTVTLYDPGGTELQAAAAGTVDSVDTTVAATVTRGDRSFTVASASGIDVGAQYLVQEGGRTWVATVRSVAGSTIYPDDAAPFSLTTSATVKGFGLSYALTATHTADADRNYRALWSVTVGGVTTEREEYFDIVAAVAWYPTTWADVIARHGWIDSWVKSKNLDGQTHLDTAWRMVRDRLKAAGKQLDKVRTLDDLVPLHAAFVNVLIAEERAMIDPDGDRSLDVAERRLNTVANEALSSIGFYDTDEDMAASSGEESQVATGWRIVV